MSGEFVIALVVALAGLFVPIPFMLLESVPADCGQGRPEGRTGLECRPRCSVGQIARTLHQPINLRQQERRAPAPVIRMRTISIALLPAFMFSRRAIASPLWERPAIMSPSNP
jgi:hypothetical protein